ncbi:MAG TPA: DUF86 domain-containing protein [Thermoanaerobaculia bacterium]|nr:DUF86 domain-containing protein [Thermoanaerobaculia bacterium]
MVDRETFDRRLGKLEQLLRDLRRFQGIDRETFLRDRDTQAKAERWLQLAGEVAIHLATQLIAERGWRPPVSYREAFQVLSEEGVLSPGLAQQMEGWAALRNVLVHLYLEVDHRRLHEILTEELDQLEDFARAITKSLSLGKE